MLQTVPVDIHSATFHDYKLDVTFDKASGYRMGSNFYTPNGTPCTPNQLLLQLSIAWSDGPMRHTMSLQEFIDKARG